MYKKNLEKKMTLRLPQSINDYVTERSTELGITPSEYIRQCLFREKLTYEKASHMLTEVTKTLKEELRDGIDQQTASNDNV